MARRRALAAVIAALLSIGVVSVGSAAAAERSPARPEIIAGTAVPAGMLPQLAWVADKLSSSEIEDCSGTVLSSNVVLTAGHCVEQDTGALDPAAGFKVVTGQPNLGGTLVGHISTVSQTIVYPGYDPMTHDGDVALLELSTPTTAPAITLATGSQTSLWQPGTDVAIAGWGVTNGSDPFSVPLRVQWATTVTQTAADCSDKASLLGSSFDPDRQLCAVDSPTDQTAVCSGDSGGPILADYLTGTPVEVGITSWGAVGCDATMPDFFARADSISTWAAGWVSTLAPAPPAPAGTPKPIPTATPSAKKIAAGRYTGQTEQDKPVTLQVSASGKTVTKITLRYLAHCSRTRGASLWGTTSRGYRIRNQAFSATRRVVGGSIKVVGRFDHSGSATGTLKSGWSSSRYGRCHTGQIGWAARH